jgi:large subunit ribosomal protein L28
MATSTIRDMEHMGGFDKFILNQCDSTLSPRAMTVKGRIRRKMNKSSKKAKA